MAYKPPVIQARDPQARVLMLRNLERRAIARALAARISEIMPRLLAAARQGGLPGGIPTDFVRPSQVPPVEQVPTGFVRPSQIPPTLPPEITDAGPRPLPPNIAEILSAGRPSPWVAPSAYDWVRQPGFYESGFMGRDVEGPL